MNSLLGFGSYGYDSWSVRSDAPDTYVEGDSYTYQGSNQSGSVSVNCPHGTIGFFSAHVDNFGSDYPGDEVNMTLSAS